MIKWILLGLLLFLTTGTSWADNSLGAALGWEYNNTPGICTKSNQLTKWPESLGTQPTEAELAIIVTEYEAYKAAETYKHKRKLDFREEADDLFMDYQESVAAGATAEIIAQKKQTWVDKRNEIKLRHPKP